MERWRRILQVVCAIAKSPLELTPISHYCYFLLANIESHFCSFPSLFVFGKKEKTPSKTTTRTMKLSSIHLLSLHLIVVALLFGCAHSHGYVSCPCPRGAQGRFNCPEVPQDPDSDFDDMDTDYKLHFPAGDKNDVPGSGKHSQEIAAGKRGWTPFEPLKSGFRWRSGLCGDQIGKPQDHMRGGEYYNGGVIVAKYKEGQVISISMEIIAHHNGFMELHLCDVAKCGGEISAACFRGGHCTQLKRVPNRKCDSGHSKRCAPIDPKYPGRWYFPCSTHHYKSNSRDYYGGDGTILYKLPDGWSGSQYVLQWFWTSANTCNPPGVIEFFDSPIGPKWGSCRGQGGAVGGVARNQRSCGGNVFPEEYLHCIDISIGSTASGGRSEPRDSETPAPPPSKTPAPSPTKTPYPKKSSPPSPTPSKSTSPEADPKPQPSETPSPTPIGSIDTSSSSDAQMTPEASQDSIRPTPTVVPDEKDHSSSNGGRDGDVEDVVLYADGAVVQSIYDGDVIDISGYKQIAIQALASGSVKKVTFWVDGKLIWTEYHSPYFLGGNRDSTPYYWKDPPVNRRFKLTTEAGNSVDEVNITFVKDE